MRIAGTGCRPFPLAPGSAWTWYLTLQNGGVRRVAVILAETIEAPWLQGDLAAVRSCVEVQSLTPGYAVRETWR